MYELELNLCLTRTHRAPAVGRPRTFRVAIRRSTGRHLAALATCAVLAGVYLLPYLPAGVVMNGELWGFLGGVADARNALNEGQFPIRVAPTQADGDRYPVFQFYANLPYTVAGLLHQHLDPDNPYPAFKLLVFAALVAGGYATYRLALRWTRRYGAGLVAAAVFLSAPYLFTDLHDRGAMAELTALCLVPVALLATWACLARRGLIRVAGCAAAWTAVGLTHNITYLYAATFAAAFVLSVLRPRRQYTRRVGRLAAAGALHAGLLAWYVGPQLAAMPDIGISRGLTSTPWVTRDLVPLDVLLSPVCRTPAASTVPRLGLQVGWVVVAGVLAAAAALAAGWFRTARAHGLAARLLVLWAVSFFVAWQPVDFWPWLPKQFYFVQFSYRLLGFTTIFGALLAGFAASTLATLEPRAAEGRSLRGFAPFAVAAAGVIATCAAYYPRVGRHGDRIYEHIVRRPQMWGDDAYMVALRPADPPVPPGSAVVGVEQARAARWHVDPSRFNFALDRPTRVVLPVLWYPGGLLQVRMDGAPAPFGIDGRNVTVDLPPGKHWVRARFVGLPWANAVSQGATAVLAAIVAATAARKWRVRRRARARRLSIASAPSATPR